MNFQKNSLFFLCLVVFVIFFPTSSFADIGPGMAGGIVATIIGFIIALLIAIFAVLYYPIKRAIKRRRKPKKDKPND